LELVDAHLVLAHREATAPAHAALVVGVVDELDDEDALLDAVEPSAFFAASATIHL